ncbi:phosphosulfolactate synthase [uncultured Mucilaginibacter sp.]|uniref:phosphosulfolactate synthase n=1 Tax=uncultured Mucilaginibacter sp. TaxID=797541 RepID=UPI0025FA19E5|nr:phosphosulfolactate synthase [uncultured Mucilaginibacter sp.]
MNYELSNIPDRTVKPRTNGLTMVMDKGLSCRQVEDFIDVAGPHSDIIKLGWATSFVTPKLQEKLDIYKSAKLPVYFGGTLFEAFIVRNQFDDYCRLLDKYKMEYAEVSDGSITIEHDEKCEYIRKLSKQITVISEVGSKDVQKIFAPYKWIKLMNAEIEAGAWKVIAEARESGNVGIYRDSGEVRQGLIDEILTQIPQETIIFEAPQKAQQTWFIKLLGSNVNLGNIAPAEVIPLETLRLGLRSDTFDYFL